VLHLVHIQISGRHEEEGFYSISRRRILIKVSRLTKSKPLVTQAEQSVCLQNRPSYRGVSTGLEAKYGIKAPGANTSLRESFDSPRVGTYGLFPNVVQHSIDLLNHEDWFLTGSAVSWTLRFDWTLVDDQVQLVFKRA
jgi:hypothetical protein